jgi:peroxiredoxin
LRDSDFPVAAGELRYIENLNRIPMMKAPVRLAALLAAAFSTTALAAPKLPRPAPEFVITMGSGEQVLLSSTRGKVVVLEILLTTCPHCQKSAGVISRLLPEYAPKGVTVLGAAINDDARALLTSFVVRHGVKFPVGIGRREAAYEFLQADMGRPVSMPQLIFIDRKGNIRAQYSGTDDFFLDEGKNIRKELDALLRDAAPSRAGATKGVKK